MKDIFVEEGDVVYFSQVIAALGDTGNAYNEPNKHVHVTIREKDSNGIWKDKDPMLYFGSHFSENDWTPIPCLPDFK